MTAKLVFLVGCPRSGTTWLQLLLAQHPRVATLPETRLFPDYVSPMMAKYRGRDRGRTVGIGAILSEDQFRDRCRTFARSVLHRALDDKPDATVIVEKTPQHLNHASDIRDLFPDAQFIHVIRDPRAVAASLLDAGRSWGRGWAPHDTLAAVETWSHAIRQGVRLRAITGDCVEIRYEQLLATPVAELERLFGTIGLETTRAACEQAVAACGKDNLRQGGRGVWIPASMSEPIEGTVRKADADSWRTELSAAQVEAVEFLAAELMSSLGYAPVSPRRGRASMSLRVLLLQEAARDRLRQIRCRALGC